VTHSDGLSADFAPSSSPKKMTSFPDENISSINRTSDFNGFEGLRVVVWQGVKDEDRVHLIVRPEIKRGPAVATIASWRLA
jgi:hypothetical protein